MITFRHQGDFSKLTRYFEKLEKAGKLEKVLTKCGEQGKAALSSATPVRSGLTAGSWYYEISSSGTPTVTFYNSNVNKGVVIAIILQNGHGTGTGGWVAGRDYINPAIQPVFDKIVEDAWKEVTSI